MRSKVARRVLVGPHQMVFIHHYDIELEENVTTWSHHAMYALFRRRHAIQMYQESRSRYKRGVLEFGLLVIFKWISWSLNILSLGCYNSRCTGMALLHIYLWDPKLVMLFHSGY